MVKGRSIMSRCYLPGIKVGQHLDYFFYDILSR